MREYEQNDSDSASRLLFFDSKIEFRGEDNAIIEFIFSSGEHEEWNVIPVELTREEFRLLQDESKSAGLSFEGWLARELRKWLASAGKRPAPPF